MTLEGFEAFEARQEALIKMANRRRRGKGHN